MVHRINVKFNITKISEKEIFLSNVSKLQGDVKQCIFNGFRMFKMQIIEFQTKDFINNAKRQKMMINNETTM